MTKTPPHDPDVRFIVTPHVIREISVTALTDETAVRHYLAGQAVRSLSALRIERALRELKRTDLIRREHRATG